MTPVDASKKSNKEGVYSNFPDKREKPKPIFNLGQLVPTADIKKNLVKEIVQNGVIHFIQ